MGIRIHKAITCVVLAALLTLTGMLECNMTFWPQVCLLALGVVTLSAFILRKERLARVLFRIVLLILLFVGYLLLGEMIRNMITPDWERAENPEADMTWIVSLATGAILAPLTLWAYVRYAKRDRRIEFAATAAFAVITAAAFLVYELRIFW